MFPWQHIDTVLLDMDGTLLDLHFDNHLWRTLVPHEICKVHKIEKNEAKQLVEQAYHEVAGTLDWYDLDYWQQRFDIDVYALHQASIANIQLREETMPFLLELQQRQKHRLLITNAHPASLALKLKHTDLANGLDERLSSHEFGVPKETPEFWQQLFQRFDIDPSRCLFIDDNETILSASKQAGVGYQLGISNPDSQQAYINFRHHPAVNNLMKALS